MAYIDVLEERPGVTGVLLGIVLRFSGDFVAAQVETIAMLLFAFGVVTALYAESWWRPAGQALSVAGAFIVLVGAVVELLSFLA